tara:strand:- start:3032 stop:3805 length:774 start_codon:yes stop_codon:yes gene_type:complete
MKKYLIYIYLLLIKYRFYAYFFNLIFLKLKNIFTFYKIIQIELEENKKSKDICDRVSINNDEFFAKFDKHNLNLDLFKKKINIYKQKNEESFIKKGPANLNLLFFCSNLTSAKNILETGVADGWSSLAFLIYLSEKNGILTSIDMPYLNSLKYAGCGKIIPEEYKSIWNLLIKPDSKGIKGLMNISKKFDLIHYDSDKSIYGRNKSYPKLWKLLNDKGIFISDDISDNMSFFKFSEKLDKDPIVIRYKNKYQGIIIK